MKMKVNYINPFIESATHVLRETTHMEVERGNPSLDNGRFQAPEISVVLGIVGDMQGQVIYGMNMRASLGIVGKMMGGVEVKELDEIGKSAIAELGNMITGNAAVRFEKKHLNMKISPPTVMSGKGITIGWPLHRALVVPLSTEVGEMVVWVCLEETNGKKDQ